ncbi:OmpW family outer membrane protein [Kiritimatiellaeota bacterium B1221]|nr:OmpW family outer membrane protein [Kiritimatiellaeota bacterium B1221]
MNFIRTQRNVMIALTFSALSAFDLPVRAQSMESPSWKMKTGIFLVHGEDTFSRERMGGGQVDAGENALLGLSIAGEYALTDRIGIEVGMAGAKANEDDNGMKGKDNEVGEGPAFAPIWLGANFYIVNSENFSFYAGPRIHYVYFSDFEVDTGRTEKFGVEDEVSWGLSVGADYKFPGNAWSLNAEISYMDVDMKISEKGGSETTTVDFNPVMLRLGVACRF